MKSTQRTHDKNKSPQHEDAAKIIFVMYTYMVSEFRAIDVDSVRTYDIWLQSVLYNITETQ